MRDVRVYLTNCFHVLFFMLLLTEASKPVKEELDGVIEDVITKKLAEDLVQSIEKKFIADLAKSIEMVTAKIRVLLQNGTTHIYERVSELQHRLEHIRNSSGTEADKCLAERKNVTTDIIEKGLHQMVICGYALIGHDPANAIRIVVELKEMIREGLKPIRENEVEVYDLLKVCGHDHDTLKKVIKCVISKSPVIKTSMMGVTEKLIDGTMKITKLMAHGAMHEACLIEVIKTIEDQSFGVIEDIKRCTDGNFNVSEDNREYLRTNNATGLDIARNMDENGDIDKDEDANNDSLTKDVTEDEKSDSAITDVKDALRRMLDNNNNKLDKKLRKKLKKLEKTLTANDISTTDYKENR